MNLRTYIHVRVYLKVIATKQRVCWSRFARITWPRCFTAASQLAAKVALITGLMRARRTQRTRVLNNVVSEHQMLSSVRAAERKQNYTHASRVRVGTSFCFPPRKNGIIIRSVL